MQNIEKTIETTGITDLIMVIKTIKILFFAGTLLFISSCDNNMVFEENKEIAGSVWNKDSIESYCVNINDTLNSHNVYVNIRQNGMYENSNLYLFINIISPAGDTLRDTVNCLLADAKGKWLGSGLGDIYSNQILYKKNIRFPHSGNYIFELEQAMRTDNLENIEDVGIRIERVF